LADLYHHGNDGIEADWAQLDPDFAAGKKELVAEDWNGAITAPRSQEHREMRHS
jgi:hypothetical protein